MCIFRRVLSACVMLVILTGCSNLLFYPQKNLVRTPAHIGLAYEDVHLKTSDGVALHGWWLPAKGKSKGSVYFLHGNAENISTHIGSVFWLPEKGYNVFLLDYRGYGLSEGTPVLPDVFNDIDAGMQWVLQKNHEHNQPVFLLGQSLGATMGLYYAATHPEVTQQLRGVVADAAMASYRQIAREKLNGFWLTWAFQYPLSGLLPEQYSPNRVVAKISPVPLLMFHSRDDEVISYKHAEALFALAGEPKAMISTAGAHITTFSAQSNREALLHFFAMTCPKEECK